MNFLKKVFASKEVKSALGTIEEAAYKFQRERFAFKLVRSRMERWVLANQSAFACLIGEGDGQTLHMWVYSSIGDVIGELLESGDYHIYRGVLNPVGRDLLKMFDAVHDELFRLKTIDADYAIEQKTAIRKKVQSAG